MPAFWTTPVVALLTIALLTVAGDADGFRPRYKAAMPATCGDENEVPLLTS